MIGFPQRRIVDDPVVLLDAAGEVFEPVEDRRQEEPRQERRRDQVLDVAEEDVRARDDQREPGDERDHERPRAAARARNASRVSGITIVFATTSTTSIATNATSCVATTDNGTSCRGKRTFLISAALSSSDRDAVVSDDEKKSQTVRPTSR